MPRQANRVPGGRIKTQLDMMIRMTYYLTANGSRMRKADLAHQMHAYKHRKEWDDAYAVLLTKGIITEALGNYGVEVVLVEVPSEWMPTARAKAKRKAKRRGKRSKWFQDRLASFNIRDGIPPEKYGSGAGADGGDSDGDAVINADIVIDKQHALDTVNVVGEKIVSTVGTSPSGVLTGVLAPPHSDEKSKQISNEKKISVPPMGGSPVLAWDEQPSADPPPPERPLDADAQDQAAARRKKGATISPAMAAWLSRPSYKPKL